MKKTEGEKPSGKTEKKLRHEQCSKEFTTVDKKRWMKWISVVSPKAFHGYYNIHSFPVLVEN